MVLASFEVSVDLCELIIVTFRLSVGLCELIFSSFNWYFKLVLASSNSQ